MFGLELVVIRSERTIAMRHKAEFVPIGSRREFPSKPTLRELVRQFLPKC